MKLQNQVLQEASCLSKILSFLIFQSSQLAIRVASVKKSVPLPSQSIFKIGTIVMLQIQITSVSFGVPCISLKNPIIGKHGA